MSKARTKWHELPWMFALNTNYLQFKIWIWENYAAKAKRKKRVREGGVGEKRRRTNIIYHYIIYTHTHTHIDRIMKANQTRATYQTVTRRIDDIYKLCFLLCFHLFACTLTFVLDYLDVKGSGAVAIISLLCLPPTPLSVDVALVASSSYNSVDFIVAVAIFVFVIFVLWPLG